MFIDNEWCQSAEGQNIKLHSSLPLTELNNYVLFIGGVHGDEPEGINLANNLLNYLKLNTLKNQWVLVTSLNPDGAEKNKRTNGNNVDLNRNFPSKDWSPEFSKDRYYPGIKAGSEPETQAIHKLVSKYKPQIIIHFHSWKPCIVLTGEDPLNIAPLFSQSSGYQLQHDIGYPTPGSLGQYAWLNFNIPVVCIEEEEQVDAQESWQRFSPAFESLLNNIKF